MAWKVDDTVKEVNKLRTIELQQTGSEASIASITCAGRSDKEKPVLAGYENLHGQLDLVWTAFLFKEMTLPQWPNVADHHMFG